MSILSTLFGDASSKQLEQWRPLVAGVNTAEEEWKALSDGALKEKVATLKSQVANGSDVDEFLVPMFAATREAARRTLGQRHYDVQLLGAITLHQGNIAEMRTGEGKTLAATPAVALNALTGQGVHVITVNDYLARRDAAWMGQIYSALGLSVGCITHDTSYIYDPEWGKAKSDVPEAERDATASFHVVQEFLRPCTRHEAYATDITYGTNNEFGFDWLRDNLEHGRSGIRQREHFFAIVDEVDSILIDEARTPLIISAPDEASGELYQVFSKLVPMLKRDKHFEVDEKQKAVTLTEEGIEYVEAQLGIGDIYNEKGIKYVRHLEQALRAHGLFHRDQDYVVRNGQVVIVDEFTGRLMPGRRWSDGLHQAVEAKEGVAVQKESRTLASVTFQNYFKMYEKLSGMTGTGKTSEEEFQQVYNLNVMIVPTHRIAVRADLPDAIFQSEEGKWKAVVRSIAEAHNIGRPVLVGTVSIEQNEKLSALLKVEGIKHEMLNAKNHEREGEIIAQAGRKGAVTVATNMAGRGVDIILGGAPYHATTAMEVCALGGLLVIGTVRHEARRIDNQLRGRAGRQGDPGTTQFYISLEDELMRVFGSEKLKGLMGTLGVPEDQPIESKMVSRQIESAQARIEGFHFDARKHLLDYDTVLTKQRSAVYRERREMLFADNVFLEEKLQQALTASLTRIADAHTGDIRDHWRLDDLAKLLEANFHERDMFSRLEAVSDAAAVRSVVLEVGSSAVQLRKEREGDKFYDVVRSVYLQVIDYLWRDHLELMEYTRSSVRLRAYGQRDPLVEYKNEASRLFRTFHQTLEELFTQNIIKAADEKEKHQLRPSQVMLGSGGNLPSTPRDKKGEKIGRNDPCPCGATLSDGRPKKYKHCHGKNT